LILLTGFAVICFGLIAITARLRVFSVFALVATYLLSALLFYFVLDAEFVALMVLVVYVGAIAVFFLFVVMILGGGVREETVFLPLLVPALFAIFLIYLSVGDMIFSSIPATPVADANKLFGAYELNNLMVIGAVLYDQFAALFVFAAVILYVAIVGVVFISSFVKAILRYRVAITDQVLLIFS
jgi:NADH-quinone oxidoreductase subunit J